MRRCASAGARRSRAAPRGAAPATGGRPLDVDGHEVDAVRESWLVEDRWWTERPLRRRYWEVVTIDGRDLVVFRDLVGGALVPAPLSRARSCAAA